MIGFNAPLEMVKTLDKISMKRWGKINRSDLMYEAVSQFVERETNPAAALESFHRALDNPEFVAAVAEKVHQYEGKPPVKKPRG
jgi:predicted transcriptional regulator